MTQFEPPVDETPDSPAISPEVLAWLNDEDSKTMSSLQLLRLYGLDDGENDLWDQDRGPLILG